MILTDQAVDHFQKYIAPHLSLPAARELLLSKLGEVQPLRERGPGGIMLWALDNPPCRLVTKPIALSPYGGLVVTAVLPPKDGAVSEDPVEPPQPSPLRDILAELADCFGAHRDPAAHVLAGPFGRLARALEQPRYARLAQTPPRVLLAGFAQLLDALLDAGHDGKQVAKLRLIRDELQARLGPVRATDAEICRLWDRVRELAKDQTRRTSGKEQHAWNGTMAAWGDGLRTLLSYQRQAPRPYDLEDIIDGGRLLRDLERCIVRGSGGRERDYLLAALPKLAHRLLLRGTMVAEDPR